MRIGIGCCLLLAACGGKSEPGKTAPVSGPAAPSALISRALFAIDANGTRLTYRISGDSTKTPVVFIHGSLADSRSWTRQEPRKLPFVAGSTSSRPIRLTNSLQVIQ